MTDYNAYSNAKQVNVIPEKDFKELVADTFSTIAETLRATYGPYGSSIIISESNETITTKDGYNVFQSLGFSHNYKKMVYLTIKKIIERVNRNVGDGTTSCILIADKLFRNIEAILSTPDDKRQVLQILDDIEVLLQQITLPDNYNHPVPLTEEHFKNIIRLASNYDEQLTSTITEAFDPKFDEEGKLVSKRNIIAEPAVSDSGSVEYVSEQLPGKYRVRVEMNTAYSQALAIPSKKKVVLFDHTFTQNDWALLTENHDKETDVIVLATDFSRQFMDNEYLRYLKQRELVKLPVRFLIGRIRGCFVQNEVQDLAAVLQRKPWSLSTHVNVDYTTIPEYDVQMYGGNCLCFDNVEPPTEYIKNLEYDMNRDLSKSIAKRNDYIERIHALKMDAQDTLLTVKVTSSLEAKLIIDKIDDCTSIINSAANNGVVPNMLRYAYELMTSIGKSYEEDTIGSKICEAILYSIKGLFEDIWKSKYLNENALTFETICDEFYESKYESFNIITDEFVEMKNFCTSSQYDIEVLVAAISIVKYLITSKAFIFDAMILRQTNNVPLMED